MVGASGKPLNAAARAYLEARFGHDFGAVRVHDDAVAAASAERLDARAYTLGRDIFFALGMYRPWSAEGRRLLAHELAHVVQHQEGAPPHTRRQAKGTAQPVPEPDEPLETALERQQMWDDIEKHNRELDEQLTPILDRLINEQEEAAEPFFVKENPTLIRLKAQLQQEKQRLPVELAQTQQELTQTEKAYLKTVDQLSELESEQRALIKRRELFRRQLPLLEAATDALEKGLKEGVEASEAGCRREAGRDPRPKSVYRGQETIYFRERRVYSTTAKTTDTARAFGSAPGRGEYGDAGIGRAGSPAPDDDATADDDRGKSAPGTVCFRKAKHKSARSCQI